MQVRMTKNLGSRDAAQVGLKFDECKAGSVVNAEDDAANWLIARGFAVPVEIEAKPEETLKGVSNTKQVK